MPIGLWFGVAFAFVLGDGAFSWQVSLGTCLVILIVTIIGRPSWRPDSWPNWRLAAIVCLIFITIGVLLGSLRLAPFKSSELLGLINEQTPGLATATVLTDPVGLPSSTRFRQAGQRYSVVVRLESFRSFERDYRMRVNGQLIGQKSEIAELVIGSKIEIRSSLRPGRMLRGVGFVITASDKPEVIDQAPWLQRAATGLRGGLVASSAHLTPDAAALLPGLTLGDTSVESDDLTDAMRAAGLAHLTAVSGANVAIVVGAVLLLTKLLGLPRPVIFLCCFLAMGMFAVLVRFEPSVLRASVMAAIGLGALILGRARLPSAALVAAVTVLLCIDPWLALSWAFALSVCATAGIILLSPWVIGEVKRRWAWLPRGVPEAFALTVCAQLATAPLTAALGTNSLIVGVPANVLAAPAVPFITIGGLVVTFVTPLSERAGQTIASLVGAPTQWVGTIAHIGANSPGANIPWPSGVVGVIATLGLFLSVGVGVAVSRRHQVFSQVLSQPKVVVSCLAVAAFLLTAGLIVSHERGLSLSRPFSSWPPADWLVAACDVGQGDGLVFRVDATTALVSDVGAEPDLIDDCLRGLKVKTVPVVVLTHFHSDHAGAIEALFDYGVKSIGVTALREPASVANMVEILASKARVGVEQLSAGDNFTIGDLAVQVIWPPTPIEPALALSKAPANDASLVFAVHQRAAHPKKVFTTLVTGDIEQAAQGAIARGWSLAPIDLYKVPHHGSSVQDQRLAGLTQAGVAVVSVGAQNSFGHPHADTIEMLLQASMRVFRTDESGDVAFSWRDGEVLATTRR